MRQKLVSIGDDYWIEDEQGERVFKVNGKACASGTPWSWRMPTVGSCTRSRRRCFVSATPWR